jgi:DNA replication initiation complex subunit (GINS family)
MADPYTALLEARRAEAAARSLTKLPNAFYDSTQTFLAEVRRTYEAELRENPGGKKGDLSRQTYVRASQVARDVVEARMSKVLSLAFQASIGGSRDLANALPEERELFDRLVQVLRTHRTSVAPFLDPTAPATAVVPGGMATPLPTTASSPAPAAVPAAAPVPTVPGRLTYVRVLKDSPAMSLGPETLELRAQDVLALPEERASLLVKSGLAERIRRDERTVTT